MTEVISTDTEFYPNSFGLWKVSLTIGFDALADAEPFL